MAAIVDRDSFGRYVITGITIAELTALAKCMTFVDDDDYVILRPVIQQILKEANRLNLELEQANRRLQEHLKQALRRHQTEKQYELEKGIPKT